MKRILYVATVVRMHIMEFHIPYLKALKEMGWETSVAAKNDYEDGKDCSIPYCDNYYDIPFERSPMNVRNFKAYRKLKQIIEGGGYDVVHCHTPVGAALTRLAARKARKKGCQVIYTAHGFHFYKGAPLRNWLIYYPVEWICSWMTDVLISINEEDYRRAKKHLHAKKTVYVPGVGIDLERISKARADRKQKRKEISVPEEAFLLLSVGELSVRKNHRLVLKALRMLENENIYYVICGQGVMEKELRGLANKYGLAGRVRLLGYRGDVPELYKAADLFVFPSLQEGLPVALMEAMACGIPCIAGDIRGNRDLFGKGRKGCLLPAGQPKLWAEGIRYHMQYPEKSQRTVRENQKRMKLFSVEKITERVKEIYRNEAGIWEAGKKARNEGKR